MTVHEKTAAKYIAPIDPVELAVRLIEAAAGVKRPPGTTSAQAFFEHTDQQDQDRWLRAANAAMAYWQECIADMQRTS